MATFEEQYQKYNNTAQGQAINQMYDAQKNSQLAQMENAYQQSKSEHEAVAKKIPTTYQASANDLAANYERQRRNFNQQAAASGINTGTGAQAALAQNAAYQRNLAGIRTAEADAQSEADRSLANLEATYKANVQSAIADNDYKRAAALLNEYKDAEARDLNKAQTLAAYGDFSGYAALYGQDIANNMASLWKASNPDLAYRTGQMSAEEYKAMTGSYPAGYEAPNTGFPGTPRPFTQSAEWEAAMRNPELYRDNVVTYDDKYSNAPVDAVSTAAPSTTAMSANGQAAKDTVVTNGDGSINWGNTLANFWTASKNIIQTGNAYTTKQPQTETAKLTEIPTGYSWVK